MTQALADFETATHRPDRRGRRSTARTVKTSPTYGTDLFNSWKLGQKGKDNGALLLIAVN